MIEKQCLQAPSGPQALGPYSMAVAAGGFIFVSGQGPFQPGDGAVQETTFEGQTRRTLDNLKAVLEDVGSGLDRVVKTTCFLSDMDRFAEFNALYAEYFSESKPARSCIEAARLPKDILVEVEAIAIVGE